MQAIYTLLLLSVLLIAQTVCGQELNAGTSSQRRDHLFRRLPKRFMIEFSGDDAENDSEALLQYLKTTFDDIDVTAPHVFNHQLWRGAMLEVDQPDSDYDTLYSRVANQVKKSGLVSNIFRSHLVPRASGYLHARAPSDGQPVENFHLLSSHSQTQIDRVREELGYTGEGVLVGIIDTGIDYNHPALGGGFGEGYKVRYGKDLIGDIYQEEDPTMTRHPDDDPMESCREGSEGQGHGTHVAGIIAGKSENFTGIAPDATLAIWRAVTCDNLALPEAVMEGMLEAADLGVDILSMSLGQFSSWPEEALSVLAERISATGVKVVAAAGNAGLDGAFSVLSPAISDAVISAASINSDYQLIKMFQMSGSSESYGYAPNGLPGNTSNILPDGEVVVGDVSITTPGCANVSIANDVQGKVALVSGGSGCSILQVAAHQAAAGAIGVLYYATYEASETQETLYLNLPIPLAPIARRTGLAVIEQLQSSNGPVELTFSQENVVAPVHTRDMVSVFSSVGPSSDLRIRPSIGGIGGYVYSSFPLNSGSWATMSGTSMACPYIAGATALYLQHLGDRKDNYSASEILERYQNYARQLNVSPEDNSVDTPIRQGAGLIQLYDAITQHVHVSPGSISFNDTANLVKKHTLKITNEGTSIASYEILNNVSVSAVPYNDSAPSAYISNTPIAIGSNSARLRFSKKTIKISPGSTAEISVSVMPPDTNPEEHIMYGGYVVFKSLISDLKDITVPYFGIVGDQRELPLFDAEGPLSTDTSMATMYKTNETLVFERSESNPFIIFLITLLTGPKHISTPLYDENERVLGSAFAPGELAYLARTTETYASSAAHFWNGTYYDPQNAQVINLAPGNYRVGFDALKVFGDPNNSDDWEKRLSATIQIT